MLVYAITPELAAMTQRNVQTLLDNTTGEFEVRLLVNGGPPIALNPDPRLVTIYHAERSSIAHAYNLAFSCAHGDTYACVHNDVEVPYGWNERLAGMGECMAFPTPVEDAEECAQRGVGLTQPMFPTGCCFMFPKALYEALGGFCEDFEGCHFEDNDFWMRGMQAGYSLRRAPVSVVHGRGKTRTELPDAANGDFRRNKEIYIARHERPDGSVPLPLVQELPA